MDLAEILEDRDRDLKKNIVDAEKLQIDGETFMKRVIYTSKEFLVIALYLYIWIGAYDIIEMMIELFIISWIQKCFKIEDFIHTTNPWVY